MVRIFLTTLFATSSIDGIHRNNILFLSPSLVNVALEKCKQMIVGEITYWSFERNWTRGESTANPT